MELKIVYRTLRIISQWTVDSFYSDVYVAGEESVPKNGPLIICSTHHNEIIDIAVLSVTIPHRRHLSFWAKSSMFRNPIMRQILESSGAIPVQRNPNRHQDSGVGNTTQQTDLFQSTSSALARNQVIGVFPEGTSYTQPGIVQVMSGAARAAVEYSKYSRGNKTVVIVPVAIVYTDKSHYQSRVRVEYGKPISVPTSITDEKGTVKNLTAEIECTIRGLSVNAPDWSTLYAAQQMRDILYPHEIPLEDWVLVNQYLINLILSPGIERLKQSLLTYFSLLEYSGLSHSQLQSFQPNDILSALRNVVWTILFIPPFFFYIPGYIASQCASRFLARPDQDESKAQLKAVGGGIGMGLFWATGFIGHSVLKKTVPSISFTAHVVLLVFILKKAHRYLIKDNYTRFKNVLALYHIVLARFRTRKHLDPAYTRLPPPPTNPFIKRTNIESDTSAHSAIFPPRISASVLVPYVLEQKRETMHELGLQMRRLQDIGNENVEWLVMKGAKILL